MADVRPAPDPLSLLHDALDRYESGAVASLPPTSRAAPERKERAATDARARRSEGRC